jgi:secretion/DNA translocation related TadE-like protein
MLCRRACDDDGVATVVVCFCAMALIAVTALSLYLGAAVLARHRAEVAADAGALAGAIVVLDGADAACTAASRVVEANGGELRSCALDGADVLIAVGVEARLGPLGRSATARARAGPVAQQAP